MTGIKIILILIFLFSFSRKAHAQPVYEHISNSGIYGFLDEMANEKIIELNTTVKPYTRNLILEKLKSIQSLKDSLNTRQRKELEFHIRDYILSEDSKNNPYQNNSRLDLFKKRNKLSTALNPLGIFYKDSVFIFGLRPIWGIEYLTNDNVDFRHTWGGGKIYGQIGKHIGFYASLRDNRMSKILSNPECFTQREGGVYKGNSLGGGDYSEMRGGITFSWKWGELAVVKDHLLWGDNYNGSIINSGRYPSYGMIKLHLKPAKWFDFNYFHGWLVSEVIDSSLSYMPSSGFYRTVYKPKYMAANMFTVIPAEGINLSFGNSIIYGDIELQPAYLVPFMFFKSIDHTINANIENQNSQMFGNISIRFIKHLHLYGSVFIDEFSIERVGDSNRHNVYSWKVGGKLSNWPVRNISVTYEMTKSLPLTFEHRLPITTYATNQYNIGHYLRGNSRDYFVQLEIKPLRGLKLIASYQYAMHGNEYEFSIENSPLDELPILKDKTWDNETIALEAFYEFTANSYMFAAYTFRNIQGYDVDGYPASYYLSKFTPEMFHGKTSTFSFGFNLGF